MKKSNDALKRLNEGFKGMVDVACTPSLFLTAISLKDPIKENSVGICKTHGREQEHRDWGS